MQETENWPQCNLSNDVKATVKRGKLTYTGKCDLGFFGFFFALFFLNLLYPLISLEKET